MNIPLDKQAHAFSGYAVAATLAALLTSPIGLSAACIAAIMITTILGFIKEAWDYEHPATHHAEAWDFLATAIGGVAGTGMIYYVMSSL